MRLSVILPDTADPGAIDQLERAVMRLGGQITPEDEAGAEGLGGPEQANAVPAGPPAQVAGARANRPPVGPPM